MTYLDDYAARIRSEVPPALLPQRDTTDLFCTYAVLAMAVGTRVQTSDVHNAWVAWMAAIDPNHLALVPFDDLTPDLQAQDVPFADAINQAAAEVLGTD